MDQARSEAAKYAAVWQHDAYRQVAPGESHVEQFLRLARPQRHHVVCDFGAGTGRAALKIAALADVSVVGVDLAGNCLDREVRDQLGERFRFRQHDLTTPLNETFDFGFCTDVLEHIPPEDVDNVLVNIFTSGKKVYLAISTLPDVMGAFIGEPLHLTVESPWWWHDKLTSLGIRIDWSHHQEGLVCFYASGYANGDDFYEKSKLNMEFEAAKKNVRLNLELGLKEVVPHEVQDTVVYLLAGGPSLNDFEEQIIEAGKKGLPIVTVNGTYNWLLERGVRPAAQVMIDGREFNRRFVTPIVDTCKYLIGSQCDHELVKSLPKNQTYLWHSGNSDITNEAMKEFIEEKGITYEWFPIPGGSTVVSRALTLLAMLGFRKVEVFGWDSCLKDDKHHAYDQKENDSSKSVRVKVGGREFKCHGWMVVQATEFQRLIKFILGKVPDFDMVVHGDGLISHIINHAAETAGGKKDGC